MLGISIAYIKDSCCVKQNQKPHKDNVITLQTSLLNRLTINRSTGVFLMMMVCTAPVFAEETATPKQHSLIHRPYAPASATVPRPEPTVRPLQPVAATAPTVTTPSAPMLHHKLTKKPTSATASAPLTSEPSPSVKANSSLPTAGILPTTASSTGSESPSKSTPASVDGPTIAPISVRPLSMSSLSNIAAPTVPSNTAAVTPLTAAAQSGLPRTSLAPSMSRLIQMSPGLANILQPSTPVVAPSSTTPSSTTPPSTTPSASSTGSVTLSWSANGESDLAGYKIYWGTSSGNYTASGSPTVIGKVTTYTVTGLQRNTTYFFALSAYDTAGNESALSAEVSKSIL